MRGSIRNYNVKNRLVYISTLWSEPLVFIIVSNSIFYVDNTVKKPNQSDVAKILYIAWCMQILYYIKRAIFLKTIVSNYFCNFNQFIYYQGKQKKSGNNVYYMVEWCQKSGHFFTSHSSASGSETKTEPHNFFCKLCYQQCPQLLEKIFHELAVAKNL